VTDIPQQCPQSPLSVTDPDEQGSLQKWPARCKIHSKRPENDAKTTVMKAQESNGQQKQLFEFHVWAAPKNRRSPESNDPL
jgi:hypothetical protein